MRVFRMVATPLLLLGLLAFLLWGASWGWRNLTAPLPSPSPTPCVTKSASTITPGLVSVKVYNGGFTTGLAGRVSDVLTGKGFKVVRTTNTEERVAGTVVRGNKDNEPALKLLQSYFVGATIEHDERVDGSVDVLLGTQYEGIAPSPLPEVASEGGVTCEYVSASPSASPSGSPEADASPESEASPEPAPSPTE